MRSVRSRCLVVALAIALLSAACSNNDGAVDGPDLTADPAVDGCAEQAATACLLPFPNDAFTVAADTPTGRRLALPVEGMPTNAGGVPVAVDDINRADGFSPGSTIVVHVPAVDLEKSGAAPSTDIGASLDEDAPILLVDTSSGARVPYWAELDARATSDDRRLLLIRPAVSLAEGHRYAVGLRDLLDANGEPLSAAVVRPQPGPRRAHLRSVEEALGDDDWWLAWDFTVASQESLSGRLRHIRDDAYEALGDGAPPFHVDEVGDASSVRTITGTYDVPLYLTSAEPGATFTLGDDGLPVRGDGTFPARFICVLPSAPPEPALPIVYGHGLLGGAEEVRSVAAAASGANFGACATDWVGMSRSDLPVVATVLEDLSGFPKLADRLQQAHVNFSYLGRLLNADDGFASDPAFQDASGTSIFAVGGTTFVGNSQGGILGGAASAVSTEWQRVVLGVPGINYSLLLTRSVDWDPFAAVFEKAYTDDVERVLALSLVQLLWDRGENNGYVQHLTNDPYDGIEPKDVLLVEAFGDHQVANVATEILARTIGARVHTPVLGEGRSPAVEPAWGIEPLPEDRSGPALVLWDYGNPPPPDVNLAPTEPDYGEDPHGAGAREPRVLRQTFGFLRTGVVDDVCSGGACTSDVLR